MRILKTMLILSSVLAANFSAAQGLELELLVRPALTSLRGNDIIKNIFDPTINFSAGISANYFLTPKTFINFGILYDKKGGRGESTIEFRDAQNEVIGQGTLKRESNFDYLSVPIQCGQRFGQKLKFEYGIGVYTAVLLKQELITTGSGIDSNADDTDDFKKIDFGLSASLNIYIPIKDSFSLKLGLNDNLGLINVSDVPVANDGTIKHNSLGLVVGLNFKIN